MDEALIDTDILSEVLKARDTRVLDRARLYLHEHARFAFSAITFYEMMRALSRDPGRPAVVELRHVGSQQRRAARLA